MSTFSDRAVLQKVNQRLARLGGAQSGVKVSFASGNVVLSGTVQFEMQRSSIVKVATSIPGVRRVLDHLTIKPKERRM